MNDTYRLPTFFIIGAAKSGTTTLYDVLKQHPQIGLSSVKEPRFFSNDEKYAKGIHWYLETYFSHIDSGIVVRGEASPQYLYWSNKVAPRLQETYQNNIVPKFICIFRDPVQRAYSHYWHAYRYGWEELTFDAAIRFEEERVRHFLETHAGTDEMFFSYYGAGLYATQLTYFLDIFSRDQFLFLLQDDLVGNFPETVTRLLEFLEVDSSFRISPVFSNRAALPRSQRLVKYLKEPARPYSLKWWFKLMLPLPARQKVKRLIRRRNLKDTAYPPMDPGLSKELRVRYTGEILRLQEIIGRDLSHWLANSE